MLSFHDSFEARTRRDSDRLEVPAGPNPEKATLPRRPAGPSASSQGIPQPSRGADPVSGSKNTEKTESPGRKGSQPRKESGLAPDHARAVADFEAAVKLFARQDFARARDLFRAIPERYPGELEIGDLSRSREAICERRAHPAAPRLSSPEDYCNQGVFLLNERDHDGALEHFRKAVEGGGSGQAWYLMACTLSRCERPREALEALGKAIQKEPSNRARAANEADFEGLRGEAAWDSLIGGRRG